MLRRWKRYSIARPTVGRREVDAVADVVASGWMTQGERVTEFEARFAELLEVAPEHVVACNNGTTALAVALMQQLPRGSYVGMPSLTYAGTLNAVLMAGMRPLLVDCDVSTWCMSTAHACEADNIARRLTGETAPVVGFLPVHLYGYLSDVTAQRFPAVSPYGSGVVWRPVIEDACEALGGRDADGAAGLRGTAGVFSFFANKQVTTLGEGGVIVAREVAAARAMRIVRGQGQHAQVRYDHVRPGLNARMLEAQAAFGIEQLARFAFENERRHELLDAYKREFHGCGFVRMRHPSSAPVEAPWLCAARVPFDVRGTGFISKLAERRIEARPMFVPLHQMRFVSDLIPDQAALWRSNLTMFHNTEIIASTAFALPLHASLTPHDVREIARRVIDEAQKIAVDSDKTPRLIPWLDGDTVRDIAEAQVKAHTR